MKKIFFLILFVLFFPHFSFAVTVIEVLDGDTIIVEGRNNVVWRINLIGIKAPNLGWPYGLEAKNYLSKMVLGKYIWDHGYMKDGEGANLSEIKRNKKNINIEMIKAGLATVYFPYSERRKRKLKNFGFRISIYEDAEKVAKKKKVGIWSD
jgi:endonuclease YncB( thermonuclease family)